MKQLISQKRDIEVYVAPENKWYHCHYALKNTNYIGTDGTYTVTPMGNVIYMAITINNKSQERSVERWGKEIRSP
eukprot:UN06753